MHKTIPAALAASLLAAAGTAGAFDMRADGLLGYDLIFDGFCDGVSGTIDTVSGLSVGTYTSSCATCPFTDRMGGHAGQIQANGPAVSLSWETGPTNLHTLIRQNGTWTHYNYDGTVLIEGTWTSCAALKGSEAGTQPSTLR